LLGSVRRSLHVIVADDDPFVPPLEIHGSPSVTVEHHGHGGHVAFVEGEPWATTRYAERRALEVLAKEFAEEPSR
jgi:predicted alpha/beta-fold hydrolase